MVRELIEQHGRLARRIFPQKAKRGQALQIIQAARRECQCHQRVRRQAQRIRPISIRAGAAKAQLAAHDRLHALLRAGFGEFQSAKQIARIRQRQRRHAIGHGKGGELFDLDRAFRERIGRMRVQMNKGHAACVPESRERQG